MSARLFIANLSLFLLASVFAVPAASAEPAQTDDDPVSTSEPQQEQDGPDIVRKPDAGRPPEDAGDRGGLLQGVLFVAMVGGVVVIVVLAAREARRKRQSASPPGGL